MEGYFLKRTLQTWQLEARNEAHPLQTMASRGLILSSPATCLTFQAKKANPTFYLAIQFTWEIHMPSKMSYLARTCQVTLDRKCYTTAVGARPARKSMHWNADSLLFHDIKLQASKLYLRCRLVVRTRAVALVPLWEGVRWESLVWASCWEHETWRVFIFQKHSIFSSQKAWLNKANRLKAPVFDHCDFSDYNGILESRRKKKNEWEGFEKSGCLFLLLLNYGSFPLKFCWLCTMACYWELIYLPLACYGGTLHSSFLFLLTTPPQTHPLPPLQLTLASCDSRK